MIGLVLGLIAACSQLARALMLTVPQPESDRTRDAAQQPAASSGCTWRIVRGNAALDLCG